MVYFYLVAYFLVVIWIQDGVAQNDLGIIWSNTNGSISPGDSYTISCKSQYFFWFYKNTGNPGYVASGGCTFAKDVSKEEYDCEHDKRENVYSANLTIKRDSSSSTIVEWSCSYKVAGKYHKSEPLKIEVRRDDSEPLELEPRRSPTDDTYSNLDRTLDDGHMYATA